MYTENYEQEIDLKEMFFNALYQWRIVLMVAVLGAAILGGYKGMCYGDYQVEIGQEDDYGEMETQYNQGRQALERTVENLEESIKEQNKYIAEAPIMQINPYNEFVSTADVLVEGVGSEKNIIDNLLELYEYALSEGEYIKEIAEKFDTESRYLKELLKVERSNRLEGSVKNDRIVLDIKEEDTSGGILHIKVWGTDRQMTEGILSAVLDEVQTLNPIFNVEIGNHRCTVLRTSTGEQVDTGLLSKQQNVRGNVAALQKNLTDFEKILKDLQTPEEEVNEDPSAKNIIKYVFLGFVGGGFVAVFAVCVKYIMNDKVASDREIVSRYKVKSLGTFSKIPEKRKFCFVDKWLHRIAGDNKVWSEDAIFEMIVTNLDNYAGNKQSLFVTGLASQELLQKVCDRLRSALSGVEIGSERDMISNASARRSMAACEGIVLVEERGISRYSGIQQELEIAGNVGVEVIGVIVG